MSYRAIYIAAVAALGIACVSVDALAARVAAGGAARAGAVGARGGAVGVRGGAVGYRGAAVGYRGGLGYGGYGGYYRPGLGLAAGAVVGGAIAASQPGYYGYDPGYAPSYYTSPSGYDYGSGYYNAGYASGNYPLTNGYGYGPYGPYGPTCGYVGGPKTGNWSCW